MGIFLAFLVAVLVGSFVEWGAHALMHAREVPLYRKVQRDHRETHHMNYPGRKYKNFDHGESVNLPAPLAVLYGVIVIIVTWPLHDIGVTVTAVLTSLSYFQLYNIVHTRYHVPRGGWIERTRVFRFLDARHRRHHAPTEWGELVNICLLVPIADLVLGTEARKKS